MKLTIICGSHRVASNSLRVADYLKNLCQIDNHFSEVSILELSKEDVPFWNEGIWQEVPRDEWFAWDKISHSLQISDAFIVVSPEWAGMVPPKLKNLFLLSAYKELGHKAALIVSVSAGQGGSFPVAELRSSAYKNNHICFIPDHLIFRNVSEDEMDTPFQVDKGIHERCEYTIKLLAEYAKALSVMRSVSEINYADYKYGLS